MTTTTVREHTRKHKSPALVFGAPFFPQIAALLRAKQAKAERRAEPKPAPVINSEPMAPMMIVAIDYHWDAVEQGGRF